MSGLSKEGQIGVGVVGGLAVLAAVFVPLLATGVIQTGPDAFKVTSITDTSGAAKNPKFIGHYERPAGSLADSAIPWFRRYAVSMWINTDTSTLDDQYCLFLVRHPDDPVSRVRLAFGHQILPNTEYEGPQAIIDSASNLFSAQDPLMFDGLWTYGNQDVANGETEYDPTDTSVVNRIIAIEKADA